MQLELFVKNVGLGRMSRHDLLDRFRRGFARFERHLGRVLVILKDINGPHGGTDKRCRIVARLIGLGDIVIEETDETIQAAVSRALDRARPTIVQRINRRRSNHRRTG